MKLLRGLLKSPGFVLGMSLFIGTLLLAFFVPLVLHIDAQTRVGLAYLPPSPEHWLGTDHMGVDMLSMLIAGLRSSLYRICRHDSHRGRHADRCVRGYKGVSG